MRSPIHCIPLADAAFVPPEGNPQQQHLCKRLSKWPLRTISWYSISLTFLDVVSTDQKSDAAVYSLTKEASKPTLPFPVALSWAACCSREHNHWGRFAATAVAAVAACPADLVV